MSRLPAMFVVHAVSAALLFGVFAYSASAGPNWFVVQPLGVLGAFVLFWAPGMTTAIRRCERLTRLYRIELGEDLCVACGYAVVSLAAGGVCPECGRDPRDVCSLRRELYGFARFVPRLEEVPSGKLRNELRRIDRGDRLAAWLRLGIVTIVAVVVALFLVVVSSAVDELGMGVPLALKVVVGATVPIGFLGALVWLRVRRFTRQLTAFCEREF